MACLLMCQVAKRLATQEFRSLRSAAQTFNHTLKKSQFLYLPQFRREFSSEWQRVLSRTSQRTCHKLNHCQVISRCGRFAATCPCMNSHQNVIIRTVHLGGGSLSAGHFGLRGDRERSKDQEKESDGNQKHHTPDSGWAVRLANENGYLSWCRNTYLTTVVAIAMLGEGTTLMSQHAAEGAFFVAGINLTWGTYHFVYNILCLRRRIGMSLLGALLQVSMATLHLMLWFMICLLYIGYSEGAEVEAFMLDLENEDKEGKV